MTRLFCLAGIASFLALGIAAFADDPEPAAAKPAQELTEADNGKTIKVKVGDLVAISLKGNPTTGYSWRTAKLDGKSLQQLGDPKYTTKPHPKGMVGVGGVSIFTFKAARPGKTEINLAYARPWEKSKPPAKTFTASIEVESK